MALTEEVKSEREKEAKSLVVRRYLTELMKKKLQLERLDGAVKLNNYACVRLIKKFGKEKVEEAILAAADDNFWKNNITSFMKLERNFQAILKKAKDKPVFIKL